MRGRRAELNLEVTAVVQGCHVTAVDFARGREIPLLERSTVVG